MILLISKGWSLSNPTNVKQCMLQQFRVYSNLSLFLSPTTEESLTEVVPIGRTTIQKSIRRHFWLLDPVTNNGQNLKGTSSY